VSDDEGDDDKHKKRRSERDSEGDEAFGEMVRSLASRNKSKTKLEEETLLLAKQREERELRVFEGQEARAQRDEKRQERREKLEERERNLKLIQGMTAAEDEEVKAKAKKVLLAFLDAQIDDM
jgi:hypothetical protein